MQTISCVITDDEPFARKGLESYAKKIEFLNLVGTCEDAIQLSNLLKEKTIDLIFLDIEMPYMTGIEFLKSLAHPPKIIFTTAYEKYALQGFELDVIDYLLKPISFERFFKSCNKAYDYLKTSSINSHEIPDHLFVKSDHKLEKVTFDEIDFIQAMQNYVAIHAGDKKIITHSTLKNILEKLPQGKFIQPHKSFLVAIEKIQSIEGNMLLIAKHEVPISKSLREEVLEKIVKNKLLNR